MCDVIDGTTESDKRRQTRIELQFAISDVPVSTAGCCSESVARCEALETVYSTAQRSRRPLEDRIRAHSAGPTTSHLVRPRNLALPRSMLLCHTASEKCLFEHCKDSSLVPPSYDPSQPRLKRIHPATDSVVSPDAWNPRKVSEARDLLAVHRAAALKLALQLCCSAAQSHPSAAASPSMRQVPVTQAPLSGRQAAAPSIRATDSTPVVSKLCENS